MIIYVSALSGGLSSLDDTDDDSEQSEGASENLNDKDLDECRGSLRISESATSASDTHAHTTDQV